MDASIPRDPQVLYALAKYRPTIDTLLQQIVGESKTVLDNACRVGECNLGNLLADAFIFNRLHQYDGPHWTDAPLAIVNGGVIRSSAAVGNISKYDMITMLPYNNTLMVLNVTGHVIRLALERSVERYNGYSGEFLQMSGIHVTYDMGKKPGQRVHSIEVLCNECDIPSYQKLDIDKQYGIIITSFLYYGGDVFDMFQVTDNSVQIGKHYFMIYLN